MVFLTILMLLITFISCDNKLNISNTNAVRFSTEIGRKATANSEWQADDDVGIYMLEHGTGTAATTAPERANKLYTADTAFQTSGFTPATAGDTLKWDDISNPTITHFDFIAYYPYDENISDPTTVAIDINRSSSEQMTGTADFLWGRTDNVQNNTSTVHLKLDHMLSRLIVNIAPSTTVDAVAINDATGGFTATVKGLNTQTTINLNDGTLDAASVIESIVMKDISDTLTQSERNEGKRRFEAVLIPEAHSSWLLSVLELEFTLTGGTGAGTYTWIADSVATSDQGKIHFDAGKQHVYNMTLNTSDEEVAVAAIEIEIQDWDTGDGINAPAVKVGVKSVSAGGYLTMILKTDGTLWATGLNSYGQLGVGETLLPETKTSTPVPVTSMNADPNNPVVATSGGVLSYNGTGFVSHTMILKKNGSLWATGHNAYGQLGIGGTTDISTPEQVKGFGGVGVMTDVKEVSAGLYHTMILQKDGTLWATGRNNYGQLGVGAELTYTTSIPVQVMTDVAAVSAGEHHAIILKMDGTLWATGQNPYGQLGDGTMTNRSTPVQVKASTTPDDFMTDVVAVFAGINHTIILKKDGTLWATGSNGYGQLGDGTTTNRSTPVQVKASTTPSDFMTDVKEVSAGSSYTMILKKDGTLWATGYNEYGQLGLGDILPGTNRTTPEQVSSMGSGVAGVSVGNSHTMILKKDGTLWATGRNTDGQLGLGGSIPGSNRTTPEQVIF
ncbi:fimbrillin family protein [Parasphaerochaeta coccoides]|uniref:Regulator of chromosome condensation RCC1 n=1 Tax=Parasphaerochaeta coccoides (strain ATCC BAA-1237 / DSM 17374 / SPN1) TaxID=760011 RepID=F4GIZ8_PARC1|nr:fimbrillin family protein [Parasphaerochaeta coccoides]AEC01293.1 regulator of chromosome condensation RCC1 [Parasphaerochaeta coccoides DSM 17374]